MSLRESERRGKEEEDTPDEFRYPAPIYAEVVFSTLGLTV